MEQRNNAAQMPLRIDIYDLGRKRVAPNIEELMQEDIWKNRLLNKWIYTHDKERDINTFMKHIYDGRKLIQVVVSDKKLFCDGVYRVYKVKIVHYGKDDIFIDPQDYSVVYNSVSLPPDVRYIDKLLEDGYITDEEHTIFLKKDTIKEFAEGLYQVKDFEP